MKHGKHNGFTLVEIVVVVAIVGIIMIISIPIYSKSVKKAMAEEGKQLTKSIASSERLYKANFGSYLAVAGPAATEPLLEVDLRNNAYFTRFSVTAPGGGLIVTVTGDPGSDAAGLSVVYTAPPNNTPQITVNGM